MNFDKSNFMKILQKNLMVKYSQSIEEARNFNIYRALSASIIEIISENWYKTNKMYSQTKQAYYFSAEFLMGRALGNNLINLGIYDEIKEIFDELKIDINVLEDQEEDPALGNGGLGRLAACFLDSLTTFNYPVKGYGIRYRNGIFNQYIKDGFQVEKPETWLKYEDEWTIIRPSEEVLVSFGNETVRAVPYDMPIIGYNTDNINTLRLWEAHSINDLDLVLFNSQDYLHATSEKTLAEDISRVLYPNDSSNEGKKLRLKQQYFFVSASLQDIVKNFKKNIGNDFEKFPDYVAIQLNDTHPVIAIPELMRIFVDVENMEWDKAWEIVNKVFSYTNHTILAEALEKWWSGLYKEILPRIYQITIEIDKGLKKFLKNIFPENLEKQKKLSILQDDMIHMAWLAIYSSHKVNGVAELHTKILMERELNDWYKIFPNKFLNITNGITQRRWLLKSNPELSSLITSLIGNEWITDLNQLKKLENYSENDEILNKIWEIKKIKKIQLANYLKETQGIEIDPNSIYDVQVKRLHEYKRQLLNILHILSLYYDLKKNPSLEIYPVTYIFGAKSAPGYKIAKGIIRLINEVAYIINTDNEVNKKIKVVFIENYRVTVAEKVFPAADISEQISTAGKEASGTGNMKFMLNGAVTLGTLDGANIEIVEEAGEKNNYIFGMKVNEIIELLKKGYDPKIPYNNVDGLKKVVDSLVDGSLSDLGSGIYREIYNLLLEGNNWSRPDNYFVLADFDSYRQIQKRVNFEYRNKKEWSKKQLFNIANAGKFSSDRTIKEYADKIWNIKQSRI